MTQLDSIVRSLRKLKNELSSRYHVSRIGVFGSIVRDDYSPDSDVDIIVDFSKPIGIEFVDLADFLESQIQRKVDLVSRDGIKKKYLREIEGQIIYV